MSAIVSRFTPSNAPIDLLERLFVGRHKVLDDVAYRVERASNSGERNHTLIVGPRGAGKTHLVTLAESRTRSQGADGIRVQTSWPLEDPYAVASYRDLLAEVVSHLTPALGEPVPTEVDSLEALIARRAAERGPIVLFIENFDQVLDIIEENGQQRLRHLLQSDKSMLLVATSTSLSHALNEQDAPFYGYFTTTHLEPFDVETAAAMLRNIAIEQGQQDVADFLETDIGLARLRTIAHLAGGQPRIWATLASSLTVDGLDELVNLLLTRFDDLTPYYQEQLNRLSPHQRRIVLALAKVDHAVSVGDLAEIVDIDERSVAKTVKELADKNWVQPVETAFAHLLDGRKTYYELSEPLARLSFQIKAARNTPIETVVEFLKGWFEPADLQSVTNPLLRAYADMAVNQQLTDLPLQIVKALNGKPMLPNNSAAELAVRASTALGDARKNQPDGLMSLPTPLRSTMERLLGGFPSADQIAFVRARMLLLATTPFGTHRTDFTALLCTQWQDVIDTIEDPRLRLHALLGLALTQSAGDLHDEALETVRRADSLVEAQPVDIDTIALQSIHIVVAAGLEAAGRTAEASELRARAAEVLGKTRGDQPFF